MITVKEIIDICHGKLYSGNINQKYHQFTNDTRKIEKGNAYIGIKGETFNGNDFYEEAFSKGASLCILNEDTNIKNTKDNHTIILVEDTIKAIGELAKYKRSLYDIPVVAVTGSVGKTSVRDMVATVLRKKYTVLSNQGNMNNHIGVPLTILNYDNEEAMVIEMGMNHLGEIHYLSNIVKPTIGIITNIGTAHIGNLGSRENILKAKLEILDGMNNGYLIINNDNDLLQTVKYDKLITVGINNKSDYMATNIEDNIFSSNFDINNKNINLPVGTRAFVYNALLAYAAGMKLGVTENEIDMALKELHLNPHRLEVIKTSKITIIDDTYNASYDSVKNSIELLSKVENNKIFIFGDILELDDYSQEIHQKIGELLKEYHIDKLITVGTQTNYTHEVVQNIENIKSYHYNNNQELKNELNRLITPGDTILVKGSHGMNLIDIINFLKNNY